MRTHISARRLRRFPTSWWVAVTATAAVIGIFVATTVARTEAMAAQYGGEVAVLVAEHPVAAGHTLIPADVHRVRWPRSFLPHGELATDAVGHVTTRPLDEGQPLTSSQLAPSGVGATAAQLQHDEQGIAIPTNHLGPSLTRGDHVDVIATFEGTGETTPAIVIASGARVIDVAPEIVTVAVATDTAPKVAFAAAKGTVVLALDGVVDERTN